jgi:hypothetical protein
MRALTRNRSRSQPDRCPRRLIGDAGWQLRREVWACRVSSSGELSGWSSDSISASSLTPFWRWERHEGAMPFNLEPEILQPGPALPNPYTRPQMFLNRPRRERGAPALIREIAMSLTCPRYDARDFERRWQTRLNTPPRRTTNSAFELHVEVTHRFPPPNRYGWELRPPRVFPRKSRAFNSRLGKKPVRPANSAPPPGSQSCAKRGAPRDAESG